MFKLPGYFTRFGSKADGSASLSFTTQELNGADYGALREHQNQFGFILFKENEITMDDMPQEDAVEDKSKTPSKRLRAALWLLHKQEGGKPEKFEEYYRRSVEWCIEKVKAKLD